MTGLAPAFLLIFSFADRTVIHDTILMNPHRYNNVALAAFCHCIVTDVISLCPGQLWIAVHAVRGAVCRIIIPGNRKNAHASPVMDELPEQNQSTCRVFLLLKSRTWYA